MLKYSCDYILVICMTRLLALISVYLHVKDIVTKILVFASVSLNSHARALNVFNAILVRRLCFQLKHFLTLYVNIVLIF